MKIEAGKMYRARGERKVYVAIEIPKSRPGEFRYLGWEIDGDTNTARVWADNTNDIISEWVEKPEWCKGNPAWARWQAHDKNGECWWYSDKPHLDGGADALSWYAENADRIPTKHVPMLPPGCHWQDSLVESPEGWGK